MGSCQAAHTDRAPPCRMVGAEGVTQTLAYTYTADGLRVAENTDGAVTGFVWDPALPPAQVLATSDGARYVHGLDLVAERRSGAWAYPLGDALGSVRQWTDEDGYVNYAGGYTPFGIQMWTEGSTSSNWGYTGEWWDASVGMVYLRARWYDGYLNRFVSPDPIVPDYRNPQSVNRYTYALGNPVRYTDPAGLTPQFPLPFGCSSVDQNAYNLTGWLVREMHHQSSHWPVQMGISWLNEVGRRYDPHNPGQNDSVILSLLNNLQSYVPWNWDEHDYQNDIATLAHTGSLLWWAGMVKDGARWDFKDQIYEEFNREGSIVLCDLEECRWYEYSMPGNIFYAYVGRVAGFSEGDIRAGAIYAQQADSENDPALNDWFLGLDQASDQAALDLGFTMFNLTQGASNETAVHYAFKMALSVHKNRLAAGQIPMRPYVLPPEISIGPDGPEFPLRFFDGANCMGWLGR
jgi:RHS repeat-associated protein